MKNYCISDHCRWVKGLSGSALYDLRSARVYSLNPVGTSILDMALSGQKLAANAVAFLNKLEEKGLVNDHSSPVVEPKIQPRLRYVWLELTNHCNCKCLHCYGSFGVPGEYGFEPELSTADWKTVISQIADSGCEAIQFIGGEPLLRPDFCELLKFAHAKSLRHIDIFTNAFFLTEEMVESIASTGAFVRVSLYGYNEKTHDAITQCHGSFRRLDCSLDMLAKRHVPVTIAVVLMQENQDILPQIKTYVESKGISFTGFDTIRPVQHACMKSHEVTNPAIIRKRVIHSPAFKTSVFSFARSRQWNSCWFGKLAVTAKGDILPCIFARDLSCGNIKKDEREMIRKKLLGYWRITKDQVDTCRDCEYRYGCDDCRPLSIGNGNGLYGKYPRCIYLPDSCSWDGVSR